MRGIEFLRPAAAWIAPAILLLLVAWRLRRRRRFVAFSTVSWLKQLRYRPSPVRALPHWLAALALGCLLVALMEPVIPRTEGQVQSQGLDIALVLDLSSSMQEVMDLNPPSRSMQRLTFSSADLAPRRLKGKTRLDVVKETLQGFVDKRKDDRIGLVVFSDHAYVVSPLTFDHDYLRQYIDIVDDQILRGEGMTAIGDGIGLANFLMERQSRNDRRNRVIVVFTDGEYNFGRDPIEALADSDAAQIRVHMVGVDLEADVKQKPSVVKLIDRIRQLGGHYFTADTSHELAKASAELDSLEKGLLTTKVTLRNTPVYDWFLPPALVLLVAALALRAIPFFADLT